MKKELKKIGMKETIGVVTNNRKVAEEFFDKIYKKNKRKVIKFTRTKYYLYILLKNMTRYIWVRPIENSRACRLSKAYIDLNIDKRIILRKVILPCCAYARRKDIMDLNGEKYPKV